METLVQETTTCARACVLCMYVCAGAYVDVCVCVCMKDVCMCVGGWVWMCDSYIISVAEYRVYFEVSKVINTNEGGWRRYIGPHTIYTYMHTHIHKWRLLHA
jgi:hypothetical protein